MANLSMSEFQVGSVVVTPSSNIPNLTEDTKYVILGIQGDFVKIENDIGKIGLYKSVIFIEPDIYYNMIFYLTLLRLFNLEPRDLQ